MYSYITSSAKSLFKKKKRKMSVLGMIGQAGGAIIGQHFTEQNRRRELDYQRRLMQEQQAYNEQNMATQHGYSKKLWDYTNVGNQVKHIQNAGLNVGLMYKGTGAGGATTSPSGGTPSGGATPPNFIGQGMMAGLQAMQTKANIDLLKSQAEKNKAEAEKTKGVDTDLVGTQIASLTQGIENQRAVKDLTEVQTRMTGILADIQDATKESQIDTAFWGVRRQIVEVDLLGLQFDLEEATINDKISTIKAEAYGAYLNNELTKAVTNKTKEEINAISQGVVQRWQEVSQGWVNLSQKQKEIAIRQFSAEIQAENPSVWNVAGNLAQKVMYSFENWENRLTGNKAPRRVVGKERYDN